MKRPNLNKASQRILALALAGVMGIPAVLNAATVSLTGSDATGTTSFNAVGKWNNAQAPSSANDYSTDGYYLRTPTPANPLPFAGASLSLDYSGASIGGGHTLGMNIKSPVGSTITVSNLYLNGAAIVQSQGNGVETVAGNITVLATSFLSAGQTNRVLAISAPISSSSSSVTIGILGDGNGATLSPGGVIQLLGDNSAYQGNWYICATSGDIYGGYCAALQVGNGGTNGNLGSGNVTNNYRLVFNRSDSLVVSNVISGSGSVTMAGLGQVTLTGANTYSGATIVNAGTLAVGVGSSLTSSSAISLNNGAILDVSAVAGFGLAPGQSLAGSGTVIGAVTSVTGATLFPGNTNGGTLTVNGNMSLGDCSMLWNLNTASLTGGTNALNDLLVVNGNLALTPGITANLVFPGGGIPVPGTYTLCQCTGTLSGAAADLTTTLGNNNYTATFFLNTHASPAIVAVNIAPVQVTNTNPQNLVWTGQNGWDWDTTTPNWNTTGGLNTNFNYGDYVLFNDTTYSTYVNLIAAVPGSTTVDTASIYNFVTAGGSISGPGGLTKSGSGTLILDLNNDYAGGTLIQAGVVQVGYYDAVGSLGLGAVTNNGAIVLTRSDAAGILPNAISGTGSVTMSGSGTATLSGDNSYSGGTTVNAGTLKLGSATALGAASSSTLVNYGAVLDLNGQPDGSLELFSISGPGTGTGALVNNSSTAVILSGAVTLASDATVGGSGNLTLSGEISGTFGLTKAGAGTTTLTAPNAFTGATVVSGGTLDLQNGHALGTSPTVTINSGANLLQLDGGITIAGVSLTDNTTTSGAYGLQGNTGNNVWDGPVTLGANYARFGSIPSGTGLNITGTVDDGGLGYGIMIRGVSFDGVVQLSGTNTYLGSTAITVGWLRLGNANALPAGTVVGVLNHNSARLDLAGFSPPIAGLVGEGWVVNSAGSLSTLTLNINSAINYSNKLFNATTVPWGGPGSNIFGGVIQGQVGVTLAGEPGTVLVFTNANTYSGDTTIASGSLILGPTGGITGSSNIIVASGATLDTSAKTGGFTLGATQTLKGNGTVLGNVTANGTVAPGASIGTLSFGNNLALEAGSTTAVEVQSDGGCDQLVCGGTLTYGGTLQVTNLAGTLTTNHTFKLFTAAGYSGAFANVTPAPAAGLAWNTDTLLVDGTLRIAATALNPTNITAVVIGGNTLQLSWPVDHKGWSLQAQTNSAGAGLSTNWFHVPNSSAVNQMTIPIDRADGSVFFRLVYP